MWDRCPLVAPSATITINWLEPNVSPSKSMLLWQGFEMDRKSEQLGMFVSTAQARLVRMLLFKFVQTTGMDKCYRCGKPICSREDCTIDHIEPWLHSDDPVGNFFNLDNIAFSHFICNSALSRGNLPRHGIGGYEHRGCRCQICKKAKSIKNAKRRSRAKSGL